MPELSQKERLQLSLLDRLTDDNPQQITESRDKRVISVSRLRELVQRDMTWLLNTTSASSNMELNGFSDVASSTLNFGVKDLTGYSGAMFNAKQIEKELIKCIRNYEPRIIANSLKVKVKVNDKEMNKNHVVFEIMGDLWAQPVPLQLFLKTEIDLEKGSVYLSQWN